MNTNEKIRENSDIIISNDVIAAIAVNAAKDVEGVSGFATKAAGRIMQGTATEELMKAVKVTSLDNEIRIQIYIRVKSGVNIQTVSLGIQRSVKNVVQSMTGKVVSKVSVGIQGIDFDEPEKVQANS